MCGELSRNLMSKPTPSGNRKRHQLRDALLAIAPLLMRGDPVGAFRVLARPMRNADQRIAAIVALTGFGSLFIVTAIGSAQLVWGFDVPSWTSRAGYIIGGAGFFVGFAGVMLFWMASPE
jgi:hypothetical protein